MQLINLTPRNFTEFYLIVYEMEESDVRNNSHLVAVALARPSVLSDF